MVMAKQFGKTLKSMRLSRNILQRQVAAYLEMDTPLYSKIERGERPAKKELVEKIANFLGVEADELMTIWLADQVFDVIKDHKIADRALSTVINKINLKCLDKLLNKITCL